MFIATLVLYVTPLIGKATIDFVLSGDEGAVPAWLRALLNRVGGRDVLAHSLWAPGLLIVVLTLVSGLFTYLKGRWAAVAAEGIARSLRERLYAHLQRLSCRFHDAADTGDLVQRCTSDVETVRAFFALHVVEVGRSLIMIVLVLPIMLSLHTRMALLSMSLLPVIIGFTAVFFVLIRRTFHRMDEAEGALTALLQENLSGIRVVRAFNRQDYECGRFAERNATYRERWRRVMTLFAWYWSSSDLLSTAQLGIVLLVGARYIAAEELSVGTFYAFWMYVNMFLWPIRHMGRIIADLGKAFVALERMGYILEQEPEDARDNIRYTPAQLPERLRGEIVFDGLSFAHVDDVPVLRDTTFTIPPGQTLAILGPSGSGKSTLINLLLRLYDYENGSVRLDGMELRDLDRHYTRSQIGVVLQDPFLYSRTIEENIRVGQSSAKRSGIEQAARAAGIHGSITTFADDYETRVGEKGVTLSGGQRQRIALARAILKDPPVLVLDDALSAVDAHTENLILSALRERHGRRTTIVIAHRLSTLMSADRALVLEDGRITQMGTHDQLLEQPGLYRRLWDVQMAVEGEAATVDVSAEDSCDE